MNTNTMKAGNTRKTVAFILIISLMITGLIGPVTSMAGNSESLKVTFKISEDESQDIIKDVPITDQNNGSATLTSESIPDDPKAAEGSEFKGWKNLSAKTQEEKDAVWSKKDLTDLILDGDTSFEAVYEATKEADSKVDAVDGVNDDIDTDKDISESSVKKNEKNSNISLQADSKISATIGGVSLNGSDDSFETTMNNSYAFKDNMTVRASFGNSTGKKVVTIKLEEGLAYESILGMTYSGGRWIPVKLPEQFENKIESVSFEKLPKHVSNYQPFGGTVTYELKSGVDNFQVNIGVKGDPPYLINTNDINIKNAIKIGATLDGINLDDTIVLENYIVKGAIDVNFGGTGSVTTFPVAKGGTYTLPYGISGASGSGQSGGFGSYITSDTSITVKMPKKAGLKGIITPSGFSSSDYSSSLDTNKPDFDYLTINFYSTRMHPVYFNITGVVSDAAVIGDSFYPTFVTGSGTLFNGDKYTIRNTNNNRYAVVSDAGNQFKFINVGLKINEKDKDTPESMAVLGGFHISNKNATTISGMRMRTEFPNDGTIGVQAVKLATGIKQKAKDIMVITNKRTLKIPEIDTASGTIGIATLNLKKGVTVSGTEYKLGEGEYILSVEYSMGDVKSGASVDNAYVIENPTGRETMTYFGRILKDCTDFSASATVLAPKSSNANPYETSDWEPNQDTFTQETKVTTDNTNIYYQASGNVTTAALVANRDEDTISAGFTTFSHRYSVGQLRAFKGFVIYLVEDEDVIISKGSIKLTNKGAVIKSEIEQTTDNSGRKVYKVTTTDATIGYFTDSLANDSVGVSFKVKPTKTAKTKSIYLKDMIYGHVMGEEAAYARVYDANSGYVTKDTFGLTGKDTNYLVSPPKAKNLKIQAQQKVTINTYADSGDDAWKMYDPGDQDSVVSLNTLLDGRYKVSIFNGSDHVINEGYTTLIPIPKKGKNAGNEDIHSSTSKFEWSLSVIDDIQKEINSQSHPGDAKYEVFYSTDYLFDKDDTNWKTWDQVKSSPPAIRTVKVVYNKAMEKDFRDSFYFPLAVPQGDEAVEDKGKVNIFSSRIYSCEDGVNSGYFASEPIALQLNTGIVSGKVMMDEDRDGLVSSSDTSMSGISVKAYAAGSDRSIAKNLLESGTTNENGEYRFIKLDSSKKVDIVFTSKTSDSDPMRFITPNAVDSTHKEAEMLSVTPDGKSSVDALLQRPYEVTFDAAGGVPTPKKQMVYVGNNAKQPTTNPAINGYRFVNWIDKATNKEFKFDTTPITTNVALKANYVQLYDIKFNANTNGYLTSGSATSASFTIKDVEHGTTWGAAVAKVPTPKAMDGYYFAGWSPKDPATINGTDTVTTNMAFTANFEAKKTLTFTALDAPNEVYNGAAQTKEVDVTMDGILVSGHTFTGTKASITKVNVGDYKITPPALTATDLGLKAGEKLSDYYYINYVNGNFSITKRDITVAPENATKEYDGTPLVPTKIAIKQGTLATGEAFNMTNSAFEGTITTPGTVTSTISALVIDKAVGADPFNTLNYNVSYELGSLTVTTATGLSVLTTGKAVTYDDRNHDLIDADGKDKNGLSTSASILYSTTSESGFTATEPTFKEAGTYNIWVKSAKDYFYDSKPIMVTATVSKRAITVKPEDVSRKFIPNTPLTADKITIASVYTANDLVSGHEMRTEVSNISGSQTKVGSSNSTVVDLALIKIAGDKAKNYDISTTPGVISIYTNTTDLGVKATGSDTVYDGKAHGLSDAYGTFENVRNDSISLLYSEDGQNYTSKEPKYTDVGARTIYVISSIEGCSTPQAVTANVNITERPITITANSDDKVYDGTSLTAKGRTINSSGLASNETLTTTYKGSITNKGTADAEINTYKITNSSNKETTRNYKVTLKKGTLKIDARPVIVVPNDASKEYDGTALKATSVKVSSNSKYKMLSGDSLTDPTFNTSITNVGSTKVKATSVKVNGKVNSNYVFSSETGTLTIIEGEEDEPVVGGQTADPGAPTTVNRNFDPTGGTSGVLGTSSEPQAKIDTNVPSIDIGQDKVPLYGTDYWALINLILTIAGIVLAILMSIIAIMRKLKDDDIRYDEGSDSYYEQSKKTRILFMIGSILLALAGLAIFLLTQDLTKTMALTDNWTIVNIIVFIAEAVLAAFAFRTKTNEVEFKDDNYFKMS